jgi:hypothetical protein
MKAVRIRSWHLASGLVSRGGLIHTLCGRWAAQDVPTRAELPGNEKTCERCAVAYTLLAPGPS